MRKPMRALRPQSGFTMIEVIMVMILTGIVIGAGVMINFSASEEISFQSAFDELESNLRYAHELAINSHGGSGIYINNSGTYTIYENGDITDPALNPANFNDFLITLPANVTIATTASNSQVEFDYFGKPSDGSGALVTEQIFTLTKTGYPTLTLRVKPNTGLVTR